MERQQGYVLWIIEDRGVRSVHPWFTDAVGQLKSVAITPAELEEAFEEGIGFDDSSTQGMTCIYEDDMAVRPDAETFSILPWRGEDVPVARMFCNVLTRDDEPVRSDPRLILRHTLGKATDMGFPYFVHPEVEFHLFHPENDPSKEPVPIDNSSYFGRMTHSLTQNLRRDTILALEDMGTSIEFSHHEAGPGQNEIDLRSTDALRMADNVMTLKTVVEQIIIEQGVHAPLVPKPLVNSPGNGMYTHFSLFEGDRPVLHDATGPGDLSRTGQKFVTGLLRHAHGITAVMNRYVSSYKHLYNGDEAPPYVYWGLYSRSALVRMPAHSPNKPQSTRVEYHVLDSAANSYLTFVVALHAGLRGIEKDYELPMPTETGVAFMSDLEREISSTEGLPSSLGEAVDLTEASELVAETLGEDCLDYFLRDKRYEWDVYHRQVTPFERTHFLPAC